MNFKKLDIESDPVGQSFTMGSYDLIVASIVLCRNVKGGRSSRKHTR